MSSDSNELLALVNKTSSSSFQTDAERSRAREAVSALLTRLSTPWDIAVEHAYIQPAVTAALKTLIDMGVFEQWVKTNENAVLGEAEVAALVDGDVELIGRLLRLLAAMNLLTLSGENAYSLTPFAKRLSDPTFASFYGFHSTVTGPGFGNIPNFLAKTGYVNPADPKRSNWQDFSGLSFFEYFAKNPAAGRDFQNVMKVNNEHRSGITDLYPTEDLVSNAKPESAVLVDVGGGLGNDIVAVGVKHPELHDGSLVLQDTPDTIAKVTLEKPVRTEAYDFFTVNPVKGAHAYYLHRVLHDWADDKAIAILKNQAAVMEKGYSRILIQENVISPGQLSIGVTLPDFMMMMIASSKERTERMWLDLLDRAGLKLVKIWRAPQAIESVIEAELV